MISTLLLVVLLAAPKDGPPFQAWVSAQEANVRNVPSLDGSVIAVLERGDRVEVTGCVPSCDESSSWALISPYGAIRLSLLVLDAPHADNEEPFLYGRVLVPGASLLEAPDSKRIVRSLAVGDVIALRPKPEDAEWLVAVHGGFVRSNRIRLFQPSDFAGEHAPQLPLAFLARNASARVDDEVHPLDRFERAPLVEPPGHNSVLLGVGVVSRSAVRLAIARPRPQEVPPSARWVHIDLTEQVLVAYEGDHPVFATMVSTGKQGFATRLGTYPVWLKVRHARMRGTREPYDVDEVPSVLFFHGGEALHGTFWHSRFGTRASHGCVNLSLADAAWLFDWAPPPLPVGWHSLRPTAAALDSLWVVVERTPRIGTPASPTPIPAAALVSREEEGISP